MSKRSKVKKIVEELIFSEPWKLVEQSIKLDIESDYKLLLLVTPGDLLKVQTRIDVRMEFIENIYKMANKNWNYTGFQEIVAEEEEKNELRELYKDYRRET